MTATVEVLVAGEPSFGELAETANREHHAAGVAAASFLEHVRLSGEALGTVRGRLSHGEWSPWVEANFDGSLALAAMYIRVAEYWQVAEGAPSLNQALKEISQHVRGKGLPQLGRHPHALIDEARALREQGLTYREIGTALGVSNGCALRWVDDEARRRYSSRARERARERAAARRALKGQAIKRALVKEGEAFNEAYALITRLDGILGQARKEAQTREKRVAINEAHALRDKAMDTLIRALGVS